MSERQMPAEFDSDIAVTQAQVLVLEPMRESFEFKWSERMDIPPHDALSFAQTSLEIQIAYNQALTEMYIKSRDFNKIGKVHHEQELLTQILGRSKAGDNGLLFGYLSRRSDARFVDSVRARASGDIEQAEKLQRVSETLKQTATLLPHLDFKPS